MFSNVLFGLRVTLPVFIIITIGYVLNRNKLLSKDFVASATNLVYYIFLPAKLFVDMANISFESAFQLQYFFAIIVGSFLQLIVVWIFGNILCNDKKRQSAFIHASYRGNFVYVGLALLQNIYNSSVVVSVALILAVLMPIYNIQGVVIMSIKEGKGKIKFSSIIFGIIKNPMVIAIVLGLIYSKIFTEMPFVIAKSLDYLKAPTSTIALLIVGATIELSTLKKDIGILCKISFVKLILMPLLWMLVALGFGLTHDQIVTLTIVGAMPTTINVYIVTKKLNGDGDLAGKAIVFTHLLSLVSMTIVVIILKNFGFIM